MLNEPVKCSSCDAVNGDAHCHECYKKAFRSGFLYALEQYGIWKDGEQLIGCMQRPIKSVLTQFDSEKVADQLAENKNDCGKCF